MSRKRAFVKYTKQGKIIPGSLIVTTKGGYPKDGLYYEVPISHCCKYSFKPDVTIKTRAFVKYTKKGKIIPGSLIVTTKGGYPTNGLYNEVPANLCCYTQPVITTTTTLPPTTTTTTIPLTPGIVDILPRTGNNADFNPGTGNAIYMAQRFTLPVNAQVTAVSIINGPVSGSPNYSYIGQIYDVVGGLPGTLLAQTIQTAPVNGPGNSFWQMGFVPTYLTAGDYYMVIDYNPPVITHDGLNYGALGISTTSTYPINEMLTRDGIGGTWTVVPGTNLVLLIGYLY